MEGPDIFDRGDFVGSGVGNTPINNEDRLYDPDGVTEPETMDDEEEV